MGKRLTESDWKKINLNYKLTKSNPDNWNAHKATMNDIAERLSEANPGVKEKWDQLSDYGKYKAAAEASWAKDATSTATSYGINTVIAEALTNITAGAALYLTIHKQWTYEQSGFSSEPTDTSISDALAKRGQIYLID